MVMGKVLGVESCDCYREDVRRYGKVRQMTGSVTVIGEVCQLTERCDGYEGLVRTCWKV